jgi:hypothetical protein
MAAILHNLVKKILVSFLLFPLADKEVFSSRYVELRHAWSKLPCTCLTAAILNGHLNLIKPKLLHFGNLFRYPSEFFPVESSFLFESPATPGVLKKGCHFEMLYVLVPAYSYTTCSPGAILKSAMLDQLMSTRRCCAWGCVLARRTGPEGWWTIRPASSP